MQTNDLYATVGRNNVMYANGVRYIMSLDGWIPFPSNPQHLWTKAEWEAVAASQQARIKQQ